MAAPIARLGGTRSARCLIAALAVLMGAVGLTACDSDDGGTSAPTQTTFAKDFPAPVLKDLEVDLQISGARTLTVRGTKGVCVFPTTGLPGAFTVTGKDYPELGPTGSIKVFHATTVPGHGVVHPNVKIYLSGNLGMVSPTNGAGVQIQPDLQSVRLNADMAGGPGLQFGGGLGPATPLQRAHIEGTMRCR